jgi:hypothetical protein
MKLSVGGVLMFLAIIMNHRTLDEEDNFATLVEVIFFLLCSSTVVPAYINIKGDTKPCLTILIIVALSDHFDIPAIFTSITIICLTDEYAITVFLSC